MHQERHEKDQETERTHPEPEPQLEDDILVIDIVYHVKGPLDHRKEKDSEPQADVPDIAEGLKPYGVERKDLPLIAERAAGNARLIGNNPRPANAKLILEMLEASYN